MKYLRTRLTYANVGVTIALVLAASGVAVAAGSSSGAVIRGCYASHSGTLRIITGKAKCGRTEKAIRWNQQGPPGLPGVPGARGPQGATGATGATGPAGANGTNGTNGADGTARAYGLVGRSGALSQSKSVSGVTHPATGQYCIALAASIDPATAILQPSPDYSNDDTVSGSNVAQAITEWASAGGGSCPAGTLLVRTWERTQSTSGGNVNSVNIVLADEGFSFIVP